MMFNWLKTEAPLPLSAVERGLVHAPPDPNKTEMREIEKAFARLFASNDGQKVLAHLQVTAFQRALGPDSSDQHLRYLEGQRAMVATILRLIQRGRKPV